MRIAVFGGFSPDPYGEADYCTRVFTALARKYPDVHITILAHRNDALARRREVLPNLTILRITEPGGRIKATLTSVLSFFHSSRLKPDVLHFQGTQTPLYGGIFGETTTILMLLSRLLGRPSVATVHTTWLPAQLLDLLVSRVRSKHVAEMLVRYYSFNLRTIAGSAHVLSILTAGDTAPPIVREFIESHRLRGRIVTEAHPCMPAVTTPEEQHGAKNRFGLADYKLVVSGGFVFRHKRYDLLLEVADGILAKHRDAVIVLFGEPRGREGLAYSQSLRDSWERLRYRERVLLRFEYLTDEEFASYLKAADVVVIPYERVMAASGPVHHALSHGKPVVATAAGHNEGLKGICRLFPPGDTVGLAGALDELLTDHSARQFYSHQSATYARLHTWDRLADFYMELYHTIS